MLGVKIWPLRLWKFKYWARVACPDWVAQRSLEQQGGTFCDLKFFRSDGEFPDCERCGYEHRDGRPGRRMVGGLSGYYEPEWRQECVRCAHRETQFWECQSEREIMETLEI
ncbi:MAG: hypothetical protein AAFV54_17065 [Pseudomonadota bacterium]